MKQIVTPHGMDMSHPGATHPLAIEAHEQIDSIIHDINHDHDRMLGAIPENVFKNVWLPFFAGICNHYNVNLNMWLSIAKNPYNEVKVVDDVTGVELYRVPAYLSNQGLQPTRSHRGEQTTYGLVNAIKIASTMANNSPAQAQEFAVRSLEQHIANMETTNVDVLGTIRRWNEIFMRYGLPPVFNLEPTEPGIQQPQSAQTFEPDEWESL